ncbi:unnamed protein product, partial [marine sediment metagenome]
KIIRRQLIQGFQVRVKGAGQNAHIMQQSGSADTDKGKDRPAKAKAKRY